MDDESRNPVLMVHGIDDSGASLARMAAYLEARGWRTLRLDLIPSDGACPLDELAQQLAVYVERELPAGSFDIVAFSMGGIIARVYLQQMEGLTRARRFVTISSPHHGTLTAWLRDHPVARQLRPGSALLTELNRDVESLGRLAFTTIWTPFDLMIFPACTSRMPVGRQVVIPLLLHPWMQSHPRVFAAVAQALAEPVAACEP